MRSPNLRILQRTLRLPQLKQGGTLSITSSKLGLGGGDTTSTGTDNTSAAVAAAASSATVRNGIPPIDVRIVPGWRDDAQIELWQQIFDDGKQRRQDVTNAPTTHASDVTNSTVDDKVVDMRVTAQSDGEGTLGKSSGHVSIDLDLKSILDDATIANADATPFAPSEGLENNNKKNSAIDLSGDIEVKDMTMPVEIDESEEESDDEESDSDGSDDDDDDYETFDDEGGIDAITLIAAVPEKVNLNCNLQWAGGIAVEGKLEGQEGFDLRAVCGNVTAKKLRGDSINIFAGSRLNTETDGNENEHDDKEESKFSRGGAGVIFVTDLLEAQTVTVEAEGRIRAKMVNGTDVNLSIPSDTHHHTQPNSYAKNLLDVDDVGALIDIGSLYTSKNGDGANVEVECPAGAANIPRAVRIKSSHGHISAAASVDDNASENMDDFDQRVPILELGGVNGSCDAAIRDTACKRSGAVLAARVHVDSLTPDSVSFVSTTTGDVDLTVDRKVECDLRLLSCAEVAKVDADALLVDDADGVRNEVSRLDELSSASGDPTSVADTAQSARGKIYVQTNSFSPKDSATMTNATEYVEGSIHNRSFEPDSRFDVKTKHSSSVTTDINTGIGKVNIMGAAAQALAGFSGNNGTEQNPLFAVASAGKIKVETVSWFGAIARRYGMEDRSKEKDLGRTASRAPRLK